MNRKQAKAIYKNFVNQAAGMMAAADQIGLYNLYRDMEQQTTKQKNKNMFLLSQHKKIDHIYTDLLNKITAMLENAYYKGIKPE